MADVLKHLKDYLRSRSDNSGKKPKSGKPKNSKKGGKEPVKSK